MKPPERLSNLQTKQENLDLAPVDGNKGFAGNLPGPLPGLKIVDGMKGSTEAESVWDKQTSHTDTPDNSGSAQPSEIPHEEYSRDEKAPWKNTVAQADNMAPQTSFTRDTNDGVPAANVEARDDGGGNPDTQGTPGVAAGVHKMSSMPQTEFTHDGGGGAPDFKAPK